jgi:dinuclear metal center YbgI/SA1388 family protein
MMSVHTELLIHAIEDFAPLRLQESWDNSGWQINLRRENTERVLVALEITSAVIEEAKRIRADLILVHHPLIFVPLKCVDAKDGTGGGGYVATLVAAGISVYAAHTSFDAAPGGMNDSLADMLGLVNVVPFPPAETSADTAPGDASGDAKMPIGRVGEFETARTFGDVCRKTEQMLGMEGRLKTVGDPDMLIKKTALCGGGGGDFAEAAIRCGCQLYITGDVKHHQAQWAKENGMCLIDGGHDGTEKHFISVAAKNLRAVFSDRVDIAETSVSADPYR